jgi:hypothetical protein
MSAIQWTDETWNWRFDQLESLQGIETSAVKVVN